MNWLFRSIYNTEKMALNKSGRYWQDTFSGCQQSENFGKQVFENVIAQYWLASAM